MMKNALPELPPPRKAYSAKKASNTSESYSLHDAKLGMTKILKPCSSASYLSARGLYTQQRKHLESLITDETQDFYKVHRIDNQKLFLTSSQILEKLNKVIQKLNNTEKFHHCKDVNYLQGSSVNTLKLSARELISYHDTLRRLLEERSSLILRQECDFCVQQTTALVKDFKRLYISEKVKMTTMPIQAFNRFIDSSDITISILEYLLKKLYRIRDLHLSLRGSYQKILNFFHVGFDMELYQILLKTNKILNKLKSDMFYWAHKNVDIFMQKLCLADPNSVSPEFLQTILEICQAFNGLIPDHKEVRKYKNERTNNYLFHNSVIYCEYKKLPYDLILQYLSYFEAKVAAERIVHFLIGECKKHRQISSKRKSILNNDKDVCIFDSSTSDYCSATASDMGVENAGPNANASVDRNSNFLNVLFLLMQRNQSLVLKYLFSITNMSSASNKINRDVYEDIRLTSVRRTWNLPKQVHTNESYAYLEETYWISFWNKVEKYVLKLIFEVPYHQYGDIAAGALILWPNLYIHKVCEILKVSMKNEDVSPEAQAVIKNVYGCIVSHIIQISWDKQFSLAIYAAHFHQCTPIPATLNEVRTHQGNLFCNCLEPFSEIFSDEPQVIEPILRLKTMYQLQTTLDCFISWVNVKSRALVSSWNLPTYLLICCSDCKYAHKLLQAKVTVVFSDNKNSNMRHFPSLKSSLECSVQKQVEALKGYISEASNLMSSLIYKTTTGTIILALEAKSLWKRSRNSSHYSKIPIFDTVEQILFPLSEVMNQISERAVTSSIVSAVSQAFLFILHKAKGKISSRRFQTLHNEFLKFLKWLGEMDLCSSEEEKLKDLHATKRIGCIMKIIELSIFQQRNCLKLNNRISPLIKSDVDFDVQMFLTEEERVFWQTLYSRRIFSTCS